MLLSKEELAEIKELGMSYVEYLSYRDKQDSNKFESDLSEYLEGASRYINKKICRDKQGQSGVSIFKYTTLSAITRMLGEYNDTIDKKFFVGFYEDFIADLNILNIVCYASFNGHSKRLASLPVFNVDRICITKEGAINNNKTAQEMGSNITFKRRYCLSMSLNLAEHDKELEDVIHEEEIKQIDIEKYKLQKQHLHNKLVNLDTSLPAQSSCKVKWELFNKIIENKESLCEYETILLLMNKKILEIEKAKNEQFHIGKLNHHDIQDK